MNIFLACGLIFILALGASKLLGRIKFPAVTSYLLLGILIGPYGLNLIPENLVNATDFIGYFVLGLVAFSLGQNFLWRELKHVGRAVMSISCFAALGAMALVTLGLLLIKRPVSEAMVLGGIAAATAPMATIMVVREYRAKGPFTRMLLEIVAIDDAWGIIAFAGVVAVAKLISLPAAENVFASAMIGAGKEIIGALVLGTILGSLLSMLSRYSKTQTESFIFSIGFILINTGASLKLGISPLLANMAMGMVVVNLTKRYIFFDVLKRIDWPFYLLFFVLCGASLQIPFLRKLGVIGAVYVAARTLGKYGGAYFGARIAHAGEKVKKYLGLGLIPQAGVALGLAIVARTELPHCGDLIFATTVATTIVFESVGPFCTKFAITKAGEVRHRGD